jgi:hypothetical protein
MSEEVTPKKTEGSEFSIKDNMSNLLNSFHKIINEFMEKRGMEKEEKENLLKIFKDECNIIVDKFDIKKEDEDKEESKNKIKIKITNIVSGNKVTIKL